MSQITSSQLQDERCFAILTVEYELPAPKNSVPFLHWPSVNWISTTAELRSAKAFMLHAIACVRLRVRASHCDGVAAAVLKHVRCADLARVPGVRRSGILREITSSPKFACHDDLP
jgi:hypothetical protein